MPKVAITPGTFGWVDLATADLEASKAFYGSLFGWGMNDLTDGEGNHLYTMATIGDEEVSGLMGLPPGMGEGGPQAYWSSYVSVNDVDEVAGRVAELGGTVVAPPFDVMEAGRMAGIVDPDGAAINLWQPREDGGELLANEHGTLVWNELVTGDAERAKAFYGSLLGWSFDEMEMEGGATYTTISNADRPNGGIMGKDPAWGEVPSAWMVYFAVDDVDASVGRVESLGGRVIAPAQDISVGRFAVVTDPMGGAFTLFKAKPVS